MTGRPRDPSLITEKRLLRAALMERRRGGVVQESGERLARSFVAAFATAPGMVVSGYWPMGDEIDPRPLLALLAAAGCRVALPVVTGPGRCLDFRAWTPGDPLEPGPFGTSHPPAASPPLRPELLLVPLLAFDRRGWRLGYGGGFYDRTLAALRRDGGALAVGVAFAVQEVAAVPHDQYDQPLDGLATEVGAFRPEDQ